MQSIRGTTQQPDPRREGEDAHARIALEKPPQGHTEACLELILELRKNRPETKICVERVQESRDAKLAMYIGQQAPELGRVAASAIARCSGGKPLWLGAIRMRRATGRLRSDRRQDCWQGAPPTHHMWTSGCRPQAQEDDQEPPTKVVAQLAALSITNTRTHGPTGTRTNPRPDRTTR